MKIHETIRRLDAVQRSGRFKLIASICIGVIALGSFVALLIAANDPATSESLIEAARQRSQRLTSSSALERGPLGAGRAVIDSALLMLSNESGGGALPVAIAFVSGASLAIVLVNLGLGLSFLSLLVIGWGIAWPLMSMEGTRGLGQLLFGAVPLTLGFLAGVEVLRLMFVGRGPINAIARNIVNEAIRMKISVVFIVMLILFLAVVPGILNENQPLRYRIQQWLQYGIGLSYAVLTLLTLFLCVASVAFEQRERIIWQTMSKPTAPWQYLIGKWVGVMSLNALLLAVTAGGVYMFTEYLRFQPAEGEIAYRVPRSPRVEITEDRNILESQVLVARVGLRPQPERPSYELLEWEAERYFEQQAKNDASVSDTPAARREYTDERMQTWEQQVEETVEKRLSEMMNRDGRVAESDRNRARLRSKVIEERQLAFRSMMPGFARAFLFLGLEDAKDNGLDLTLTYKIQAGSNDPSDLYKLTILLNGIPWPQEDTEGRPLPRPGLKQAHLDTFQTLTLPHESIAFDGAMLITIINGAEGFPPNEFTVTIPPDGLEILYPVGTYTSNFVRILFVLWIKLGFIAGVSLMAATFLSFPVASLVALAVLFAAESAGFLHESLEHYASKTETGMVEPHKVLVRLIAVPVANAFKLYADLRPTTNLVDGRLVGWGAFARAVVVVGGWTIAMVALGWAIFRKRELALYSGN